MTRFANNMLYHFFPMSRGDLVFILALIAFSFVSFLPWSRSMTWGGMAMQGWMMALLMVIAPAIALARLLFVPREPEDDRS